MIITFTANPSIDRTIALGEPLARGEVQRATSVTEQAAGKGVNVATVLANAGLDVEAVGAFVDPSYQSAGSRQRPAVSLSGVTADGPYSARVNTTITEPDGTTTKINEPGPTLSARQVAAATDELVRIATERQAQWVVLSGSLPPGAPADWYAQIVRALKPLGCRIAIDTSDAALTAVLDQLPDASFDLVKPNSDELAQLTGGDAAAFEAAAAAGDVSSIVGAACRLQARGIANVLVSLGGAGAVLVTADGAWYSPAPETEVRSTVGAGDSTVAGFILAQVRGASAPDCLASAVAHGSAAAGLPGTRLPSPRDIRADSTHIQALTRCRPT